MKLPCIEDKCIKLAVCISKHYIICPILFNLIKDTKKYMSYMYLYESIQETLPMTKYIFMSDKGEYKTSYFIKDTWMVKTIITPTHFRLLRKQI